LGIPRALSLLSSLLTHLGATRDISSFVCVDGLTIAVSGGSGQSCARNILLWPRGDHVISFSKCHALYLLHMERSLTISSEFEFWNVTFFYAGRTDTEIPSISFKFGLLIAEVNVS